MERYQLGNNPKKRNVTFEITLGTDYKYWSVNQTQPPQNSTPLKKNIQTRDQQTAFKYMVHTWYRLKPSFTCAIDVVFYYKYITDLNRYFKQLPIKNQNLSVIWGLLIYITGSRNTTSKFKSRYTTATLRFRSQWGNRTCVSSVANKIWTWCCKNDNSNLIQLNIFCK